jgi:hypothetical protein
MGVVGSGLLLKRDAAHGDPEPRRAILRFPEGDCLSPK